MSDGPLTYIKNELFPGDASGFMKAWRGLDDDTKSTLKQWALEEMALDN